MSSPMDGTASSSSMALKLLLPQLVLSLKVIEKLNFSEDNYGRFHGNAVQPPLQLDTSHRRRERVLKTERFRKKKNKSVFVTGHATRRCSSPWLLRQYAVANKSGVN